MAVVSSQKNLGAYFTPTFVASWMASWAIRDAGDRVLDPSVGDGVILEAATKKILQLGGIPSTQLHGAEIDLDTYSAALRRLSEITTIAPGNLLHSDFFEIMPTNGPMVEAVIGNPPYIRHHRFNGEIRERAITATRQAGVKIDLRSSSWAAFLIHSCGFLTPGGRLAMVLPLSLTYAMYARPVLNYILSRFSGVDIVTFRERMFRDISEDAVLLLADGYGGSADFINMLNYDSPIAMVNAQPVECRKIDIAAWDTGSQRLATSILPLDVSREYELIKNSSVTQRFSKIAQIDIGYVTGNKNFFHVGPNDVALHSIPESSLHPSIINGRVLQGLSYTLADFYGDIALGRTSWLYRPDPECLIEEDRDYIELGELSGVHLGYKCRNRSPWWRVPMVEGGDAVLTIISHDSPRLVTNQDRLPCSNSLLRVRFRQGLSFMALHYAAAFCTSLVRISAEIEGHGLGGGALKLDPREAGEILVPSSEILKGLSSKDAQHIIATFQREGVDAATEVADLMILHRTLGISKEAILRLKDGIHCLQERRKGSN